MPTERPFTLTSDLLAEAYSKAERPHARPRKCAHTLLEVADVPTGGRNLELVRVVRCHSCLKPMTDINPLDFLLQGIGQGLTGA